MSLKCEAFLDGILQSAGEAELLVELVASMAVEEDTVLFVQPLSMQDSTCF